MADTGKRRFIGTVEVEVELVIDDYDEVVTRVVENRDGFQDSMYSLPTDEDVIKHLMLLIGVRQIPLRHLEGWLRDGADAWITHEDVHDVQEIT